MHVVVLGAGVVGTTTALALAEGGHQVTVIDRQPGPALETSFANGAQISACHAKPWAAPDVPFQALKWMFQPDAPLLFRPMRWDPPLWAWGLRFLRNCTPERVRTNMGRALRVSLYSRDVLRALRQRTNIQYNQVLSGILHIYRTRDEFAAGRANAANLELLGLPQEILSPADCVRYEPALEHAAKTDLVGGLMSPADESGDARLFTEEVMKLAQAKGAVFRWNETVVKLEASGRKVTRVITSAGDITADAFVLAAGSYSPMLARDLGLVLPIYPAKGYSISTEITVPHAAPTISVTDETRYMVFSRLGNVMRVAGTAELAGWNTKLDPVRVAPLVANAKALFPTASAYTDVNPWCGLRPTTPDSVPILGRTRIENLMLNTGHGTLGWTMAAGSAHIIADLMAGRTPEIDMNGLGLDRFGA
ncbi:MAG: D-amino acid dehydrogenase [Rhodospirillaceae bacterium]|nr:D-amino acid dehydrogenase [Rhodospirillaceae bacterium]